MSAFFLPKMHIDLCELADWRSSDARDFKIRLMVEAAERLAKAALDDSYPWFAADPARDDDEYVVRRFATKTES